MNKICLLSNTMFDDIHDINNEKSEIKVFKNASPQIKSEFITIDDIYNMNMFDFYSEKEKKIKSELDIYDYTEDLPGDDAEKTIEKSSEDIFEKDLIDYEQLEDYYTNPYFLDEISNNESFDLSEIDSIDLEEPENIEDYYLIKYEVDIDSPENVRLGIDEFIETLCDQFSLGLDVYYQLYEIFENKKSVHYKTKEVIIKFLKTNCTVEEIVLAYHIKELWKDNSQFHASYHKYNIDNYYYLRNVLSWELAMKIIKSFNSLPDLDEIDYLLHNLYEFWLEKYFRSFRYFYDFLSHFLNNPMIIHSVSPISLCEINSSFLEEIYG